MILLTEETVAAGRFPMHVEVRSAELPDGPVPAFGHFARALARGRQSFPGEKVAAN